MNQLILFCVLFGTFLAWGVWESLEIEGVKSASWIYLTRKWAEDAKVHPERYLTTKQAVAVFETPIHWGYSIQEIKPAEINHDASDAVSYVMGIDKAAPRSERATRLTILDDTVMHLKVMPADERMKLRKWFTDVIEPRIKANGGKVWTSRPIRCHEDDIPNAIERWVE